MMMMMMMSVPLLCHQHLLPSPISLCLQLLCRKSIPSPTQRETCLSTTTTTTTTTSLLLLLLPTTHSLSSSTTSLPDMMDTHLNLSLSPFASFPSSLRSGHNLTTPLLLFVVLWSCSGLSLSSTHHFHEYDDRVKEWTKD